jgi:hypothetical protein
MCLIKKGKEILDEIHLGYCGNHAVSRTLVGKAFRNGFYWPTVDGSYHLSQTVNFVQENDHQ